ncbi:MAG: bifunctional phosphoribosylaminoimidazolecarboxamide formyltransferase/IMP cyclohydrolase [Candidatus Thermoplasmatota archaeon]|nr:bifunctional phosphoribosylaminoimidazolecarboxamide formyltransferase/IMP cyclohydrolase [Candidatus Thermoplasmatota archaeon]
MSSKVKNALISVSDKNGLEILARGLSDIGIKIISSGGTHRFLSGKGIECELVKNITGFPEILGGRVKTLHPNIYGGILGRRDIDEHRREVDEHNILPIDMVIVNLYPFERTVEKEDVILEEAIENIDIGGPSLIRAAAKNHNDVIVVVDPSDYGMILEKMRSDKGFDEGTRRDLALKAFQLTSSYDIAIGNWLQSRFHPNLPWGDSIRARFRKEMDARYGENPHQQGAYFVDPSYNGISVSNSDILWGKDLSYNNIYDIDAVTDILVEFPENSCCAIIKHNNPSGVAIAPEGSAKPLADAFELAFNCDPISAFGGIIGLNRECNLDTAERINQRFFEVVIAPSFSEEALSELKRKKNLRIIRTNRPMISNAAPENRWVKIKGGLLVQTMDWPEVDPFKWKVVSSVQPEEQQLLDLAFASKVVKHVKSNCVVMAKNGRTVGIGAGQMSRVDSCFIAGKKAGENAKGSVLSSDAFFPFRDGIDAVADVGVLSIGQPGGSIRDQEVINAVDEHGMSMVFTGLRLFKH